MLSFRDFGRDVHFLNEELKTKFSYANLAKSTIKVEVTCGPPLMPGLPGKKERLTVCKLDNLIVLNLSPCLSRTDPTSLYDFVRGQADPAKTLKDVIQATVSQLALS